MTISALAGASMGCVTHLTNSTGLPRSQPASRYSSMFGGSGADAHHIAAGSPPSATAQGMVRLGDLARHALVFRAALVALPVHRELWRAPLPPGSNTCKRYMPTLRVFVAGSRVMTCGSVMYRPPSCGQHLRIGSADSERSSPVWTTSWHGARLTIDGPSPIERSTPSMSPARSSVARKPLRQAHVKHGGELVIQLVQVVHAQRPGHPPCRAKGIDEHRHRAARDVFEQQRLVLLDGAFGHAVGDLGDFQFGVNLRADADQLAALLQQSDKLAQISKGHVAPTPALPALQERELAQKFPTHQVWGVWRRKLYHSFLTEAIV